MCFGVSVRASIWHAHTRAMEARQMEERGHCRMARIRSVGRGLNTGVCRGVCFARERFCSVSVLKQTNASTTAHISTVVQSSERLVSILGMIVCRNACMRLRYGMGLEAKLLIFVCT